MRAKSGLFVANEVETDRMGKAATQTIHKTRTNRNTFLASPTVRYSDLVLRIAIAAEGHAPTVAGVLGVSPQAVTSRLARRAVRERWFRQRETRQQTEHRRAQLRHWWRKRLQAIGVDPVTVEPDDPLWIACWRLPRGALVRAVAAEMRAERPGEPLATTERLLELLERVAALAAASPTTVKQENATQARAYAARKAAQRAQRHNHAAHVARLVPRRHS